MRTRIKQTQELNEDGVVVTTYRAQVHCWYDSLTWFDARTKLNWLDTDMYFMKSEETTEIFGAFGSLERAQAFIDRLLLTVEKNKQEKAAEKARLASRVVTYIKYP